jgi:hypothetical protein
MYHLTQLALKVLYSLFVRPNASIENEAVTQSQALQTYKSLLNIIEEGFVSF